MTVAIPVTGTTITTAWGTQVATDVNGLLARTTSLEGINAGTRLGTAESEIDALQAATSVIGTRNTHTYNPGQLTASGDPYQFEIELLRTGITANGPTNQWTTITAGVYAISWFVDLTATAGYSILSVGGSARARALIGSDGESYGSWTGYIPVGQAISVLDQHTGAATPYLGGSLDIFRVAQGG